MRVTILFMIILILTAALSAFSQDNAHWGTSRKPVGGDLQFAKNMDSVPAPLTKIYSLKKHNFYSIDLNSDGKKDFIVEHKEKKKTCFIDSSFEKKSCEDFSIATYGSGFRYMFFAQLDNSLMLELFDLEGDEDYNKFFLKTFDEKTWKLKTLLPIYTLLESKSPERTGTYWAYPWDVEGLKLQNSKGTIQIMATFKHDFTVDPMVGDSREHLSDPALLLYGTATQGNKTGYYDKLGKKMKWMSLKEILDESARITEGLKKVAPTPNPEVE